jgi:hypothetical protein
MRAVVLASGMVIVGALVASINSGCGEEDPTATNPSRLARKGEACQTTNDCSPGLACLPGVNGTGSCVLGVFNVSQTAKECAVISCTQAADCCDEPGSSCSFLKQQCQQDLAQFDSTKPTSCAQYEAQCVCDANKRDCENGRCITKCTDDSACSTSGGKCLGGKCGRCAIDDDCKKGDPTSELTCVNAECKPPCKGDGDCPGFERCLQGKCIEGGCQTNRECISATRNVEATCGTDGKCIVPCQTDLECGNPKGYSFYSCVQGQCLYMGCESDKDCRLYLTGSNTSSSGGSSSGTTSSSSSSSSSGGFSSKEHVVCRDKLVPNPTTRPAQ